MPLRWSGAVDDLPGGYSDAIAQAVEGHGRAQAADTLVVMAAQVRDDQRGRGLATELLGRLRSVVRQRGLARLIVPVRPTLKASYPLTPMARFAHWTRDDGSPLDRVIASI